MSIQVLPVLVLVLLRTCIKVLYEHIQCIECHYFLIEFDCLALTLSLSLFPSVYLHSLCTLFLPSRVNCALLSFRI